MKKKPYILQLCVWVVLACFTACQPAPYAQQERTEEPFTVQPTPESAPSRELLSDEPSATKEEAELPPYVCRMIEEAIKYQENQEYDKAKTSYLELIDAWPQYTDAYMQLANVYIALGQKSRALRILSQAAEEIGRSYNPWENEKILNTWWNIMVHVYPKENETLSQQELAQIEDMAYFLEGVNRYYFVHELRKKTLLTPLYIYYQTQAIYDSETGRYSFSDDLPYTPDDVKEGKSGMTYSVVSAERVNTFVNDLLGTDVPNFRANFRDDYSETEENYLSCRNEMYYFEIGDYIYCKYIVEGYQYLGEDMFYIILAEDWNYVPGNIAEDEYYEPDGLHIILQRSGSAWGFTAVSFLKDGRHTLLQDGWQLPVNITWVTCADFSNTAYPTMEERKRAVEQYTVSREENR